MKHTRRRPTHPGEVLMEDILKPLGITITRASETLGVSRKTMSEVINGRCAVTADMAIRIAKATGTTPESWLNMQVKLDLWEINNSHPVKVERFTQEITC